MHLFWVDERCVPPDRSASNYKLAEDHLIQPAHIPHRRCTGLRGAPAPKAAAERYADEIRDFFGLENGEMPHFDLVHRGMGPDAHTASLFPGDPLIDDREGIAAAVYVEKFKQWRVTLLPGRCWRRSILCFWWRARTKPKRCGRSSTKSTTRESIPRRWPHHGRGLLVLDQAAAA